MAKKAKDVLKKYKKKEKTFDNPFDARKYGDDIDAANYREQKSIEAKGMMCGGEAKVKKVITGLQKASKLHAAQAKTLKSVVKASDGQFAQKLEPYDGSYIKGNLAGHEVSNKSYTNYYKGMLDE